MHSASALTKSVALASLVRDLEPSAEQVEWSADIALAAAFVLRAQDDPTQLSGVFVAHIDDREEPDPRKWLRANKIDLGTFCRQHRVSRAKLVFPGANPAKAERESLGRVSVRVLSAVDYVWVDKLRVFDRAGQRDEQRRRSVLSSLGSRWRAEEEADYTPPSLTAVEDGSGSTPVMDGIKHSRPEVPAGRVTVLYGAGGIGKTYFLRRLADRMKRDAMRDSTVGIPVFAELPVLLHTDALETWLARKGLPLHVDQISALVRHGVVVPVLDALDELVRGQAREGSRLFLAHLEELAATTGRIVLSSRDYFLNLDPLVREGISSGKRVEFSVGYFRREARRRYIELRTGLDPAGASRWAGRLEEQTRIALADAADEDLSALIGHPLFLDALCRIIEDHPAEERVAAADSFEIASPDVFSEIVTRILVREEGKVKAGWESKFRDVIVGAWAQPYAPEVQRRIFRSLVLLVARDGGAEVLRRSADQPQLRELRHGAFTYTTGMPDGDLSGPGALKEFLRHQLGEPELTERVNVDDAEKVIDEALDSITAFYRQHTLVDTRADNPTDLVMATRHRAYFDYLLADALLDELRVALASQDPRQRESLIAWCLEHHLFERADGLDAEPPFASCLDFVMWHRESAEAALEVIDAMFAATPPPDETVASYVSSLALAIILRGGVRTGMSAVRGRSLSIAQGETLEFLSSIVPAVSSCEIERCSFPNTKLADITLSDVLFLDSDFAHLTVETCTLRRVDFTNVELEGISFRGNVQFSDCRLDWEFDGDPHIEIDPAAEITFRRCEMSRTMYEAIRSASDVRPDAVRLIESQSLPDHDVVRSTTSGEFFVNKLMSLCRRHGRTEYAVYGHKLRGRSRATRNSYPKALEVLVRHGAVTTGNEMVYLTPEGEAHRYSGKARHGTRSYEDVREYWDPIVEELDAVFASTAV